MKLFNFGVALQRRNELDGAKSLLTESSNCYRALPQRERAKQSRTLCALACVYLASHEAPQVIARG